jgi:hypothetical protein
MLLTLLMVLGIALAFAIGTIRIAHMMHFEPFNEESHSYPK